MTKNFQDIRETIGRLERIQTRHIESFDAELMPDLESQTLEKKKEFDLLKESVNQWVSTGELGNDGDTEPMVHYFIEQIQILLNQNKMIEKKVRAHKEFLQESLKKLSRGKQVIGSYGSPSTALNRPRAIDLITN